MYPCGIRYQKSDAASQSSSVPGRSVIENTVSPCRICCCTSPLVKNPGVAP